MVILGDNVVSENVKRFVGEFQKEKDIFKAKILIAKVKDPQNYGVVTLKEKRITSIIEKPKHSESSYVNTGLWMFLPDIFSLIKKLKRSPRGEYEITDILSWYAQKGVLSYSILKSNWTDAGTLDSLYNAIVLMKKRADRQKKNGKRVNS